MKNDIEQTPTSTPTSENQSEANYQPEQHEADNNLETATEVQETPSEQTADSDNTKPEQHNNDTDSKIIDNLLSLLMRIKKYKTRKKLHPQQQTKSKTSN